MGLFRILIMSLLHFTIFINDVFALRPYVTTDADVVEKGKIELELGYFGIKEEKNPSADEFTIEFTDIRLNYGLLWDTELVLETVGEFIDDRQMEVLNLGNNSFQIQPYF
jgi:hypothetical protein